MALGEWIRFRVSEAQARIYEAEAEARGVPLGTYVRERLEQAGALRDELATLQASVDEVAAIVEELRSREHVAQPMATPASPVTGQGVAVETLLLLRTLAGPQKSKMVAAEVKRLGHDVWDAEEGR